MALKFKLVNNYEDIPTSAKYILRRLESEPLVALEKYEYNNTNISERIAVFHDEALLKGHKKKTLESVKKIVGPNETVWVVKDHFLEGEKFWQSRSRNWETIAEETGNWAFDENIWSLSEEAYHKINEKKGAK